MPRRQIVINAAMSIVQTSASAVVLFILYRYLLQTIGIEQLGIWSLVMAATSMTRAADLGLSSSIVKFVAKYVARGEQETVSGLIQTATVAIALAVGVVLLIAYFLAVPILRLVVPPASLPLVVSLLPYAFVAFWITSITSIFQSGLDGYQRIDERATVLTAAVVLKLLLCFSFIPTFGIIGLAYAQVLQTTAIAACTWLLLKRHLPLLPIIPHEWNRRLFREMAVYGINIQLMNFFTMTYDPITKAFLARFGGLTAVGYYEMASRMICQFHSLIVAANQVLTPFVAGLQEINKDLVRVVYAKSYRLVFYIAVPCFLFIIALTPVISQIWIGRYEPVFVVFSLLLGVAYLLNILSYPAYFSNLAIGELTWNTIGYATAAIVNAGLGLVLGVAFGGIGVVCAWVVSLVLSAFIILITYSLRHRIPLRELLPGESTSIGCASLLGLFVTTLLYCQLTRLCSPVVLIAIIMAVYLAITVVPMWTHPMRRLLFGWITALGGEPANCR